MTEQSPNTLYYGDNLDVLRLHIKDESVDLVYLDPPFNSNANYNVLFAEHGTQSAAQIHAFEDTWRWDEAAALDFQQTVAQGGRVADALRAFRTSLGTSDMLAYLSMMAPRLVELRRVMKSTAGIFLHCDPTASHYLKLLMDAVFEPRNFVNEIIWKRSDAHSDYRQGAKHLGRIHDTILFYACDADKVTFNAVYTPLSTDTADRWYRHIEPGTGRRYNLADITGPGGAAKGNPHYEFLGVTRYWRYSRERMQELYDHGLIVQRSPGAVPAQKRYLDESKGVALQDLWTDIPMLRGLTTGGERLGYPTQKPQALLERILAVASNEGDLVLDPFCGCGTTIAAAQALKRRWVGIDITHLAIGLIKYRLADTYGPSIAKDYSVVGEPTDVAGAEQLAHDDPFQFQAWALGLVHARVATSAKKGGDLGIDGRLYFYDESGTTAQAKQVIFSVKAGHLVPPYVRELRGVLDRENAQIGVLISFETPSPGMRAEAAACGFYESPYGESYQRLQLLTVADLLDGHEVAYPHFTGGNVTHRRAPRAKGPGEQKQLSIG